jgi:hypothetical protein
MSLTDLHNIHTHTMVYLWIGISSMLTITATFSSSKFSIYVHSIGFSIIALFTIIITYPLLLDSIDTLDPVGDFRYYFHTIFGSLLMCALIVQIILGILTRFWNIFGARSLNILNIKRFHMISGIIMVIIMKVQVYYMIHGIKRVICLIIDLLYVAYYCYRKIGRPQLTYEAIETKHL